MENQEKADQNTIEYFEQLVLENAPRIRAFVAARVITIHVEDLTQEAFLVAWDRFDVYQPDQDFGSWVVGIAHNLIRNHWRRVASEQNRMESIRGQIDQLLFEKDPFTAEDQNLEKINKLKECLNGLSSKARLVIHQRYFDKMQIQVIAKKLGATANAISKLMLRTQKTLRECMEQ